jgi:hypothetical protein
LKNEGTQQKKIRISSKLRDLLDSKMMQQILGPDKVFLLRLFVGVPFGINVKHLVGILLSHIKKVYLNLFTQIL